MSTLQIMTTDKSHSHVKSHSNHFGLSEWYAVYMYTIFAITMYTHCRNMLNRFCSRVSALLDSGLRNLQAYARVWSEKRLVTDTTSRIQRVDVTSGNCGFQTKGTTKWWLPAKAKLGKRFVVSFGPRVGMFWPNQNSTVLSKRSTCVFM